MRRVMMFSILMLVLAACHTNQPITSDEQGVLPIRMNLEPALQHGFTVTRVAVTITKGSFSQSQDLTINGSQAEGSFTELEPGTYAIDVLVYDNLNLIATGHGIGTVEPGQNTTVYINLQFVPGGLEIVVGWGLPYEDCRRVLLVGNSHTYFNGGVNTHLQALLNAVHPEWNAVVSAQTGGGYTLENHYNDPNTLAAIQNGNWDLVILQEQSSRPMEFPDLFNQYAILLNDVIAQSGSLTGFYMTWAWRNNPEMFVPIRDAYYYIGAYLDALVSPAGVAFYNAQLLPRCPDLYDADNYHPSLHGTYLVACLMLARIWNLNPIGNSYVPTGINAEDALLLQTAAWDTAQSAKKLKTGLAYGYMPLNAVLENAA